MKCDCYRREIPDFIADEVMPDFAHEIEFTPSLCSMGCLFVRFN